MKNRERMLVPVVLVLAGTFFWSGAAARDCYSCSGEDCVKVSTAGYTITCPNADDLCYTRFDVTTLLAMERGCLTLATVATCIADECVSCDTDDLCNELGHPQHQCAVCSSVSTAECGTDPAGLAETQCAAATSVDLTAAQCYSRVIGSVTERGCITSQSEVDGCNGVDCATCTGAGCNKVEFPTDRQQCIDCENTDTCAVKKSCEKALSSADATYCQTNPAQCAFCGKKLCNGVAFSASNSLAGNQRSCYRCAGTGCLRSSADLATCRLFDDDCFSSFSGFNPTRRGCSSELSTSELRTCREAEAARSECAICSESECNLVSRADHRCAYCSSVANAACIAPASGALPVLQCPAPSTEILSDAQCYTKVIGASTERGCISAASDLLGCSADGSNCATCGIEDGGQGCNTQVFPSDRRRCMIGSTVNAYCPNPWDDCVQLLQGGIRRRTCRSLLTATERAFCSATSNRCQFCSTDNCNVAEVTFDYVDCLSCDSTTDSRCATNPAALTTFTRCTHCATAIIAGTVRRGCLASMPAEVSALCTTIASSTTQCQRCSTNRCNRGNFPAARLQCYRCTNPPCVSHQSVRLEYCPEYRVNDTCVLQTDASGQLLRLDCSSSLTEAELSVCSASAALCQTCSTPGCNDPMAHGTSGSCVQCRSGLHPLCRDEPARVPAEPCSSPTNAACYSRLVDVGGVVGATERGCFADLGSTEQSACTRGENCLVCNSRIANCNTVQYPVAPLRCFQCDSRTDGDSCRASQTIEAPECPTYDLANKCYTVVQANGATVRKCSTASRETECASVSTCEVCLYSGCNRKASGDVGTTVAPVVTTTPGPRNGADDIIGRRCLLYVSLWVTALAIANIRTQ
uniref:DUF753 domain-containing protein n=1 Tax=Anopheles atroparvus TaxID=41427 RepID=A0A182IXC5_ANOAO